MQTQYICIDLKSFYASVECVERGLDPMQAKLVVADPERTEKTICLAVSPALKAMGVRNRCRVFEIPKNIDYITAPPRMQLYIDYSAKIYGVYLSFVSRDDIHVYSVDEAFIDVTHYLPRYRTDARGFARMVMDEILAVTGVRATCGIGTNLYLAKIALDIKAKHAQDFIGELDEKTYCSALWDHRPLTDFWRIGPGTAEKLASRGIYTMRDIARADEDMLYAMFGVDAELLIDHAFGREPVSIADIKAYRPKTNSMTSGQVLMRDYRFDEGLLIVKEMADAMSLDLVRGGLVTDNVTLRVGYSNSLHMQPAHGSANLSAPANGSAEIIAAAVDIYERTVDKRFPVRRMSLTLGRVFEETDRQYSMFDDAAGQERAKRAQQAVLCIKDKFGKNAIVRGTSLCEAATARERNTQIGGHKSGEKDKA